MSRVAGRWIVTLGAALALTASPVWGDERLARKVRAAREVYLAALEAPDRAVPKELIEDPECLAVIPGMIKGALGWGGRHGHGVITCRNEEGKWSPPAFVRLSGASFGFQIGAEVTDLLLFFMTERGARSLLTSKFTLGADASVAAGPVGRTAEAATDLRFKAEIYSYARSRGLFAGLSLEGTRLAPHQKAIRRYYGRRIFPETILFDHDVPRLPAEAREFLAVLP